MTERWLQVSSYLSDWIDRTESVEDVITET
jgi:hypothetical protein